MHSAIENLWFGPSISDKTPDVRQSDGSNPFATILREFQARTKRREGWEWDETSDQEESQGGLDAKEVPGISHPEMCDLIETMNANADRFETVEREGRNPLFVPSKVLANWAYRRRESGSDKFQEAARRVVNLRARHEGGPSPISGQ